VSSKDLIMPLRIACLLCCHNRKSLALACLESIYSQLNACGADVEIFLLDDGSTDGTSSAVRERYPLVKLFSGSGDLFWCGAMRVLWRIAAQSRPDYFLLLNDDTFLYKNAIEVLLSSASHLNNRCLVVGSICDPIGKQKVYGGFGPISTPHLQNHFSGMRYYQTCNANCLLIPDIIYQKLGIFHGAYTHAMGDFDYGYLATRSSIPILETPDFVGECSPNDDSKSWRNNTLSRSERFRFLAGPKGLPFREWLIFCRRNYGLRWPIKFVGPTIRIILGM
jgi:GT2 family glycosyltransferase